MGYNKSVNIEVLLKTIFTIVFAIGTGVAIAIYNIPFIVIGGCFTLIGGYQLYKINIVSANRINMLLEAIQNKDYSFRFKNAKSSNSDKVVFGALNSITDLLKQEKLNIIQREKYYELILNSLKTAIIVINDNGNVVQTNNEVLTLFGLHVLTHVRQLNNIDKHLENVLLNLQSGQRQHLSIKIESKELHLFIKVSQIEASGKAVKVFTINDIHSEIDKNELDSWIKLTRVLTHEIMNGIAPISSLSDSLLNSTEIKYDKHTIDALETIRDTSLNLLNFVDSYRKFASIPVPNPSLIYIKDMICGTTKLAEPFLLNINISVEIIPDDIILYADNSLISQVILNLIKNASEAFANIELFNPQIKIKSYCAKDESVIIEISNNGPAISQIEAEQIFIPFFTTKKDGSGVGLSISRQIMLLSGGSLTLRCDYNKEFATTFVLSFN